VMQDVSARLEIGFKSSEAQVRQAHQQSTANFDTVVIVLERESRHCTSCNGIVEHGGYISARVGSKEISH
jgi:hypothetical protein